MSCTPCETLEIETSHNHHHSPWTSADRQSIAYDHPLHGEEDDYVDWNRFELHKMTRLTTSIPSSLASLPSSSYRSTGWDADEEDCGSVISTFSFESSRSDGEISSEGNPLDAGQQRDERRQVPRDPQKVFPCVMQKNMRSENCRHILDVTGGRRTEGNPLQDTIDSSEDCKPPTPSARSRQRRSSAVCFVDV